MCASVCPPGGRFLDVGAGSSNRTSQYLSTLGELHGVDPSEEILSNDALVSAAVVEGDAYPFPGGWFDACVSDYVVEHVIAPIRHLREIHRVLRPGGVYVFRTPNLWHYVALLSAATPHAVHRMFANRLRALPDGAHEPWPTCYRMNTRRAIRRCAAQAEFVVERLDMVEKEPSYGMATRALFFPLLAYERAVNATEALAGVRSNIFAVLRRATDNVA